MSLSTSDTLGHGGPAVLALHGGLGWDSATLRPWLDPLAERARLTYVDLLGCGASPEPDDWSEVTNETWAEGVEDVRDRLDAEAGGHGCVVVFGHSYGAAVALEVARLFPDRVAGLVLCAPPPRPAHLGAAAARAEARLPNLPPETGPALRAALSAPPETDAEFAAAMAALLPLYVADPDAHDLGAFAGRVRFRAGAVRRSFYGLLAEYDPRSCLGEINAPALVLSGRRDWVSPPDEAPAELAAGLGAEHVVFERSGHFPFLEEPGAFASAVGRWLGRLADAPGPSLPQAG
ncbi:alpha/beta fold hydrolase [Rubrivirga sp.]|uniref:alpha/beta fold hydrolase n=1 Tax=Rubrivirga sp. TaxID=1885344 RepID=UPI003B525882